MSSRKLNPNQFQMFMPAHELMATHSIDIQRYPGARLGGHWKSHDEMWKTKRKENKADGLGKHVAEHGVHEPVLLAHQQEFNGPSISNGHHRIAAAYDANPRSEVPVEHEDYDAPRVRVSNKIEEANALARVVPGWKPTNRFPSYP